MGVEEARLERLILKQLFMWFGMPVLTALLVAGALVIYLFHMISAEIAAYIGFGQLLAQVGMTAGILAFLLLCYFVSTWVLFRRMSL